VRFRAEAGRYRNEPATALIHFGMKRRRFSHTQNMRPESLVFQSGNAAKSNFPTTGPPWLGWLVIPSLCLDVQ
jgi:hypothetical protein